METYWKWSFPPFALANISVLFRDIAVIEHRVGEHQSWKRIRIQLCMDPDLEEIIFFFFYLPSEQPVTFNMY